MKKGDDAFNARDFAAVDEVHHRDMVAHITGSPEPIYGAGSARRGDAADAAHLPRHARLQRPVPHPVRKRRLDHRCHPGHWDLHREMPGPDGNVIAPTGKAFDVEFGQTTKWDGDQLILISAFWDAALQARQLGLAS
jgi:ketosteroid isomerase-like protein